MTHNALSIDPELTILMAVAGIAFGLIYFAAINRSVAQLVGGRGWFGPLALTLGRIAAAIAFFYVAVKLGAAPLLASFVGFLIARALALRVERRIG